MLRSIRLRLNLYYGMVLLGLVLAVYIFLRAGFREHLLGKVKKEMRVNVQLLDRYIKQVVLKDLPLAPRFQPKLSRALDNIKKNNFPYRITIILRDGLVLADSDSAQPGFFENHKYRVEIVAADKKRFGSSIRYSTTFRKDMIYLAFFNGTYTLRIARLLTDVDEEMSAANRFLFFFTLLLLTVSFVINIVISWHVARPVRAMMRFTDSYRDGNLASRMVVRRSDEIGQLQNTMNDMGDRIEQLVAGIRSEKERLENVISTVTEALALVTENGTIAFVNQVFAAFFPESVAAAHRPYYEVIDSPALNSAIETVFKTGKSDVVQVELLRLEEVHLQAALLPVVQDKSLLLILRDITQEKKYNKMKSDFFANASHELKTPLSIVSGYIESLLDDPEADATVRRDFLGRASVNLERLTSLVKDITTLTRLEDGSGYFECSQVDLKEILQGVVMSLSYKALEGEVRVEASFGGSVFIAGNSGLLESLFFNLLDNAISYNQPGGYVSIELKESGSQYIVEIKDDGVGFGNELSERIFERFYRVDIGRSRNKGGTGLGLSIVKHAVRFHGGTITAYSAGPNQGSLFTVVLPKG